MKNPASNSLTIRFRTSGSVVKKFCPWASTFAGTRFLLADFSLHSGDFNQCPVYLYLLMCNEIITMCFLKVYLSPRPRQTRHNKELLHCGAQVPILTTGQACGKATWSGRGWAHSPSTVARGWAGRASCLSGVHVLTFWLPSLSQHKASLQKKGGRFPVARHRGWTKGGFEIYSTTFLQFGEMRVGELKHTWANLTLNVHSTQRSIGTNMNREPIFKYPDLFW